MTMSFRQRLIAGIVATVVVALGAYGIWLATRSHDPYAGLVTSLPVDMDEPTREYFEQRLATTEAALTAQESSGQEVDLNLYLSAASDAYALGDLVTARQMLEKQLAANSLHYVAWNNYGLVLEAMGDYVPAETAFKKAIEIQPRSEKYYSDYGDFLKNHFPERRDDLKAVYESSLPNIGQTVWSMTGLANWYAQAGDCDQVQAHADAAVALAPKNQSLKDDMNALVKACKQ